MGRHLILTDGRQFDCDWCGAANGTLSANLVHETDILEVATAFSDENATKVISFMHGESADIFEGYTHLTLIREDGWPTGGILAMLRQAK